VNSARVLQHFTYHYSPITNLLPLRQNMVRHLQAPPAFKEFRHWQFVTVITAVLQHGDELRRALRQNDLRSSTTALPGKMLRFFL